MKVKLRKMDLENVGARVLFFHLILKSPPGEKFRQVIKESNISGLAHDCEAQVFFLVTVLSLPPKIMLAGALAWKWDDF